MRALCEENSPSCGNEKFEENDKWFLVLDFQNGVV